MNKFASGKFLFVCVFLKQKHIFSCTFDLYGRIGDKKSSPGQFPETRLLFFWPKVDFSVCQICGKQH